MPKRGIPWRSEGNDQSPTQTGASGSKLGAAMPCASSPAAFQMWVFPSCRRARACAPTVPAPKRHTAAVQYALGRRDDVGIIEESGRSFTVFEFRLDLGEGFVLCQRIQSRHEWITLLTALPLSNLFGLARVETATTHRAGPQSVEGLTRPLLEDMARSPPTHCRVGSGLPSEQAMCEVHLANLSSASGTLLLSLAGPLGDHRSARATSGALATRALPLEHAVGRVGCTERAPG